MPKIWNQTRGQYMFINPGDQFKLVPCIGKKEHIPGSSLINRIWSTEVYRFKPSTNCIIRQAMWASFLHKLGISFLEFK